MKLKKGIALGELALVACFAAVAAYGDIYDDAIFWFRGGTNVTANGRTAVKGDFFDSIHANDPTHKNHTASIWGYEDCRVLRYEDVQFPCNRDDRKSVPVLHLSCKTNTAVVGGVTTNMLFMPAVDASFLKGQITNVYTMVARLRCDPGIFTNSSAWFARLGYGGVNGGILYGFMHSRTAGQNDCVYPSIYCPGTNTSSGATQLTEFWFTSLRIPSNGWFDVSLVVSGGTVRAGIARPMTMYSRSVIEFQTLTGTTRPNGDKLSRPSSSDGSWRFFCENANENCVEQPWGKATKTSFMGSVQQLAFWKRALTDSEVYEAWGWPHEKVFKVGLENGASNEFGSNAAPAAQTIDAYGPLGEKSPNIPAGGTWTVKFFGATNEVGLAQLLKLTTTAGSAAGTISASVNGTSVGSQTVRPGRTATWYVPGTAFKKGPNNTLTLTRTDSGSGNLTVDAVSIGGSWQIGISGVDWSDMSSESYVPTTPGTTTFDLSRKHWAHAANASNWTSNRTFRVWLPDDVAANYPHEFDIRSAYYNGSAATNYYMEVFVNGQLRNAIRDDTGVVSNRISTTSSHKLYRIPFEPGELRAGWNEFLLHGHARPTGGYFMFDYYRFQLTGNRQNGTIVIIR